MQLKAVNNQNTFGTVYFNEVLSPVLKKALSKQVKIINEGVKGKDVFIRDSINSLTEAFTGVTVFIKGTDNSSSVSYIPGRLPFTPQKLKEFVQTIVRTATATC